MFISTIENNRLSKTSKNRRSQVQLTITCFHIWSGTAAIQVCLICMFCGTAAAALPLRFAALPPCSAALPPCLVALRGTFSHADHEQKVVRHPVQRCRSEHKVLGFVFAIKSNFRG